MKQLRREISEEPTFRGKTLGKGMRIKYLGRKKDSLEFEIGKMTYSVSECSEADILGGRIRISVVKGFGVRIEINRLSDPEMSYFGRTELAVDNPGMDIMIGIDCKASFKSVDIGKEKIEVKIRDQ